MPFSIVLVQAVEQQVQMCVEMATKVEPIRLEGLEAMLPDDCQQERCDDDTPDVIGIDGPKLA